MFNKKQCVNFYNGTAHNAVQINGMIAQGWTISDVIASHGADGGFMLIYEKVEMEMSDEEKNKWIKAFGQKHDEKTLNESKPTTIKSDGLWKYKQTNSLYYLFTQQEEEFIFVKSFQKQPFDGLSPNQKKEPETYLKPMHVFQAIDISTAQRWIEDNFERHKTFGEEIQEQEESEERSFLGLTEEDYQLYKQARDILKSLEEAWVSYLRRSSNPIEFIVWLRKEIEIEKLNEL